MSQVYKALIWVALAIAILLPVFAAGTSPLLEWRRPIYIAAGFSGIIALALLLVQPLLIGGYLPGLSSRRSRQIHQMTGALLVTLVAMHVAGLWITSPPDVLDALFFAAPTRFSIWGVIAMWAILATALLGVLRRKFNIKPVTWRIVHTSLASTTVICTVLHAVPIEGTMEIISKIALCALVVIATMKVVTDVYLQTIRGSRGPSV
jgi:predicted ferric reductase